MGLDAVAEVVDAILHRHIALALIDGQDVVAGRLDFLLGLKVKLIGVVNFENYLVDLLGQIVETLIAGHASNSGGGYPSGSSCSFTSAWSQQDGVDQGKGTHHQQQTDAGIGDGFFTFVHAIGVAHGGDGQHAAVDDHQNGNQAQKAEEKVGDVEDIGAGIGGLGQTGGVALGVGGSKIAFKIDEGGNRPLTAGR